MLTARGRNFFTLFAQTYKHTQVAGSAAAWPRYVLPCASTNCVGCACLFLPLAVPLFFFFSTPFFLRACPLRSRPRGPACALFSSLLPRGRRHPSPTPSAAPRSSCCCLRTPAQLAQNGFPAPPPRRARRKRVGAVLFVELPHLPQQPTVLLLRQLRPMHELWRQHLQQRIPYKLRLPVPGGSFRGGGCAFLFFRVLDSVDRCCRRGGAGGSHYLSS